MNLFKPLFSIYNVSQNRLFPLIYHPTLIFQQQIHLSKMFENSININRQVSSYDSNFNKSNEKHKYKRRLLEIINLLKENNILLQYEFSTNQNKLSKPNIWHTTLKTNWPEIQRFEANDINLSNSKELAIRKFIKFYEFYIQNNDFNFIDKNKISEKLKDFENNKESHDDQHSQLNKNESNTFLNLLNSQEEIKNLKMDFPFPKQAIQDLTVKLSNLLKINQNIIINKIYTLHRNSSTQLWKCTIHWWWPEYCTFEGFGTSKTDASNYAALRILNWLSHNNFIDFKGNPIFPKTLIPDINSNLKQKKQDKYTEDSSIENYYNINHNDNNNYEIVKESSILTDQDISNSLLKYPNPKNTLNTIASKIKSELNQDSLPLKITYKLIKENFIPYWKCIIYWTMSKPLEFEALAHNKSDAYTFASLKVLLWLEEKNMITNKGELIYIKKKSMAPEIFINEDNFGTIPLLINKYFDEIEECINVTQDNISSTSFEDDNGYEFSSFLKEKIDKKLLNKIKNKTSSLIDNLPISKFRNAIINLIDSNRVLVVEGQPGCGKSTQVPQYILDEYSQQGKGSDCRILITQPRRISAISLAQRIAEERFERIGEHVGYQVRFDGIKPEYECGSIFFCTTGLLLKRMLKDSTLKGISHVIIDEVHERDCNTDLLLTLLERALHLNQDLKLILMSATINTKMFIDYYTNAELETSSIKLPGFTYPVKSYFIDNKEGKIDNLDIQYELKNSEIDINKININLVVKTIDYIHKNRPLNGAILVFLPGWSDISQVLKYLQKVLTPSECLILPVHSRLRTRDQRLIFNKPSDNKRKIILSTNLAESSITINDVVYVIDTGAHKEYRYTMRGVSVLSNHWVSKASVKQRKGRAGRVQTGECFHLYTENQYNLLDEFPVPEIHRILLTKIFLDSKIYAPQIPVESFLQRLPEPPNKEAIQMAKTILTQIEAINTDESLTELGKILSTFSCDPLISKTLVYGTLFRCISPLMTIAALNDGDLQLFTNDLIARESLRQIKSDKEPTSDHIACSNIYQEWVEAQQKQDYYKIQDISNDYSISPHIFETIRNYRLLYSRNLFHNNLCSGKNDPMILTKHCNTFSNEQEFIKSILYSGLHNLLENKGKSRFFTISCNTKRAALITSESVNFKDTNNNRFYTYYKIINPTDRFGIIHETSSLSPLAVVLFTNGLIQSKMVNENIENSEEDILELNLTTRNNIKIYCNRRTCDLIMHLRTIMWKTKEYLMINSFNNNLNIPNENYIKINDYFEEILKVIVNLLNSQNLSNIKNNRDHQEIEFNNNLIKEKESKL